MQNFAHSPNFANPFIPNAPVLEGTSFALLLPRRSTIPAQYATFFKNPLASKPREIGRVAKQLPYWCESLFHVFFDCIYSSQSLHEAPDKGFNAFILNFLIVFYFCYSSYIVNYLNFFNFYFLFTLFLIILLAPYFPANTFGGNQCTSESSVETRRCA